MFPQVWLASGCGGLWGSWPWPFWSSPFRRAGEDGLAVGWFCGSAEFLAAQMAWSVQGRVHARPWSSPGVCAVPPSCRRAFPDASQEPAGLYPVAHPVRVAGLRGHGRVVVKSRKRADRRNTGSAPSPSGPHREAARSPPRGTGSGSTGSGSRWPAPARSCSPGALSPAASRPASSSPPAASSRRRPGPAARGGIRPSALRTLNVNTPVAAAFWCRLLPAASSPAIRAPSRRSASRPAAAPCGPGPARPPRPRPAPGPSARPSPGPPRTPMRPAPGSRRAAAPAERQLGEHAGGRLEPGPCRAVPGPGVIEQGRAAGALGAGRQ